MQLTFRDFELDTSLFTLRCNGELRLVEPRVFDLLVYLARHRDRIVTRQELFDALWTGKVVTDSTLSSCVKAARRALGDNGQEQNCIATIHRRGYRFVTEVQEQAQAPTKVLALAQAVTSEPGDAADPGPRRASIAVMPFADLAAVTEAPGGTADALAHDVIARLAQMRSLFVIAQGTVFALKERRLSPQEAGLLLKVDYVVSGSLQRHGPCITVTVELAETRTARIIWTEVFSDKWDDALCILHEIGNKIVASVASEVEMTERNRAMLRPPNSLDAWEAHHRGLWHMYRFSKEDNQRASQFFEMAVRLDPSFSRAYAGLSFTHFQNAFQGWAPREPEINHAYEAASQSLIVDERNPAAHWAMGRALWLRGHHDQAVVELGQAVDLSPSFALAHYTLAFVHSQAGDPRAAISSSDHSRLLSPFDPLLFGMLGARAMALVRLGQFKEAADWAVKAAARPNAHAHILGIAAYSLALAGSLDEARAQAIALRQLMPRYTYDDFIAAFRFDPQGEALFRKGAQLVGMA